MLQGVTEAALIAVDGGSLEDVLKSFTVGFITGIAIQGVGKALSKIKFCFIAGTGVLMASGAIKAIENIRVGDTSGIVAHNINRQLNNTIFRR